jgi:hypothetical protein
MSHHHRPRHISPLKKKSKNSTKKYIDIFQ